MRARDSDGNPKQMHARSPVGGLGATARPSVLGVQRFFFPSLHCREVGVGQGGHWLNQMGSSLLSGALGFGAAQMAYWANNCLQRFEDGLSSYCRQQPNPYLTAIWCVFVCPLDRESSH